MKGIRMSSKEIKRVELLSRVKGGELKLVKAAELSRVSYRQMKRVWGRYKEEGAAGVAHRSRGRKSNRGKGGEFRGKVLARYQERYGGFGPTLASEYLRREGVEIDHETLRRWLLEEGLWTKVRKRGKHRAWRERRGHSGELIQMDGSHHDWFEGRGESAVLMVMVDDATGRTYARFYKGEETRSAMDMFMRYVKEYGIPRELYVDGDSIYKCTREARIDEELQGETPLTQFGRAMKKLGVEIVEAKSAQAKGRVERRNGVFQDRLVKAMRLEGIRTIEEANRYLEKEFLPEVNLRFTVRARESLDLHRSIPEGMDLREVLCFEEPRVVQNDWTVRWRNRYFQISRKHESLHLARRSVIVREHLDGSVSLEYRGEKLNYKELPSRPQREQQRYEVKERVNYRPAANHAWRRYAAVGRAVRSTSSDELCGSILGREPTASATPPPS